MIVRITCPRLAALLTVGLIASASSASAQTDAATPGSKEHVQSLLDAYAPGVDLDRLNLPRSAFRTGVQPAVPGVSPSVFGLGTAAIAGNGAADAAAARARAQSVLNQVAPGMVTLGERGVRVEVPGAPVVDTRGGMPMVDGSQDVLHRLAIDQSLRSLREGDYARSARWIEAVAADRPRDGDVRQLASLVLLGEGRVDEAAEAAKAGLKHSPAWDRARLGNVHPNYDDLLQSLRNQAQQNPTDGKIIFLLAYHELMLGRTADAAKTLAVAAEHLPEGWLTASVQARFEQE